MRILKKNIILNLEEEMQEEEINLDNLILNHFLKNINLKKFPEVDHVHFFGYYIGNYPTSKNIQKKKICSILNNISLK